MYTGLQKRMAKLMISTKVVTPGCYSATCLLFCFSLIFVVSIKEAVKRWSFKLLTYCINTSVLFLVSFHHIMYWEKGKKTNTWSSFKKGKKTECSCLWFFIAKLMHHNFKCINDFIDHVDIVLRPRKVVGICLFLNHKTFKGNIYQQ